MLLNYEMSVLPGGLRVVSVTLPARESVSVGIWAGAGARYEGEREAGAAHFLEHVVFKGTERRSALKISEDVEGIGGDLNAMTGEETTVYYAKARGRHLGRVLDVLGDMYLCATLPEEEVERERGVIKEEIMMGLDTPGQYVQELLAAALWPGQALGRSITGTVETVGGLSRAGLLRFRKRHYRAANTVVAAAGNVVHAELVERVAELFRGWGRGAVPVAEETREVAPGARVQLLRRECEQAHLAMGVRTFSRLDERRYAMRVLCVVLGENMSSRLFQEVREKRGLAYAVSSSLAHFSDAGLLNISAGLECGRVVQVVRLIMKELRRLREKRVSAAELRRAKDYAAGSLLLGLESSTSQMMWSGEGLLLYGRVHQPEEVAARLERVTAQQVQEVAQEFLRSERMSLALVAPRGEEEELRDALSCLD